MPVVVQDVYFPSPQSATVGAVFGRKPNRSGAWPLYVSGGFENRIWRLKFTPGAPAADHARARTRGRPAEGDTIELAGMAPGSADATYNGGREPLYPDGSWHQLGRT